MAVLVWLLKNTAAMSVWVMSLMVFILYHKILVEFVDLQLFEPPVSDLILSALLKVVVQDCIDLDADEGPLDLRGEKFELDGSDPIVLKAL